MGFKLFRDGKCVICGKHATYFSDETGKFYCNEHSKQGNPHTVPTLSGDSREPGSHKYRWGKNEKFKKSKFQVNKEN